MTLTEDLRRGKTRRPTRTTLAHSEAALVAELRRALEAFPLVKLLDDAPERGDIERNIVESGPLPEHYQGIRHHTGGKKYEHGDPTADRALNPSRPRVWLDRFERLRLDLAWLASNAQHLVGPANICPCGRPIQETEPRHGRWHRPCYDRHRKDSEKAAKEGHIACDPA